MGSKRGFGKGYPPFPKTTKSRKRDFYSILKKRADLLLKVQIVGVSVITTRMWNKLKIRLEETLLQSETDFIQVIYAVRALTWFISAHFFDSDYKIEALQFLNSELIHFVLLGLSICGFWGWLFKHRGLNMLFAYSNVIFYAWIGYTLLFDGYLMTSMTFIFEELIVIWLAFRITINKREN
jgi:hypothetical protein